MRTQRRVGRVLLAVAMAVSVAVVGGIGAGRALAGPISYVVVEEGATETCTFGRLDLGTGALTNIGAVGGATCVASLTFGPDGTLYGLEGQALGEQHLVRIDLATGIATAVGTVDVQILLAAGGLAFDRAGALWLYIQSQNADCSNDFSCLYRIDPIDATTTFVGGGGSETIVGGLAGQCDGRVLTARGVPPQQLAAVDTFTGGLTDLGPLDSSVFVQELATTSDGTLYGLASLNVGVGTQILRIDPAGPTVTTGPLLTDARTPLAFAIEPLTCPAPPPPPPVPEVVAQPRFTG